MSMIGFLYIYNFKRTANYYHQTCNEIINTIGKIALSDTLLTKYLADNMCQLQQIFFTECVETDTSLRLLAFLGMLLTNSLMVSSFLKALETDSSLQVTVLCSSVNFLMSGWLGVKVLNESVNGMWWIGVCIVCIGIFCVATSSSLHKK